MEIRDGGRKQSLSLRASPLAGKLGGSPAATSLSAFHTVTDEALAPLFPRQQNKRYIIHTHVRMDIAARLMHVSTLLKNH